MRYAVAYQQTTAPWMTGDNRLVWQCAIFDAQTWQRYEDVVTKSKANYLTVWWIDAKGKWKRVQN